MNRTSRTTVVLVACISVLVVGAAVAVLASVGGSGPGAERIPVVQIGLPTAASSLPQGTSSSVASSASSTSSVASTSAASPSSTSLASRTTSTEGVGQTTTQTTTGPTQTGTPGSSTHGRETVPSTLRIRVGGGGPELGPSSTGGPGSGPSSTGGPGSGR